jgi:diaminohydroxyphosphoribosylaminopyrimidine deaminase/5-amino-6-(5-phosphoribosylamino)uracil reductase
LIVPTEDAERVNLKDLLSWLYALGITSVLLEGGAELAWSALEAGVVDRCLFFYAPIIIGGTAARPGVGGTGIERLGDAPGLEEVETFRVGPDILVTGRVRYARLGQK